MSGIVSHLDKAPGAVIPLDPVRHQSTIRVLHVLHTLDRAGVETLVADLATAHRDRLETAIACLDREGPLAERLRNSNIDVHFTRRRAGFDWTQVFRIAAIIRSFRPRVVHCHQYTPFVYGTLASLWARRGRILFTEHGRHVPDCVGWKRRLTNRFLIRRAASVTAVCDFTRSRLVQLEGFKRNKIEVLYNGVDLRRFDQIIDRQDARSRLALPYDANVIVHVGTFRPVKDQATAIRAFQRVLAQSPETILLFAGDGPDLAACRALATELNVQHAVRFLGQRSDIPKILAAADIMLLTSLSEGHSVALLEAMASRLPIVATRVGGIPETVIDGQTGLLAPVGNHEAIAEQLLYLIRHPEQRQNMGQAGSEHVRSCFDQDNMHRRYIALYDKLAAHGGPA
jgi:N-acetyl-alpha-D-glucosaminyl L-malate synthase BshA